MPPDLRRRGRAVQDAVLEATLAALVDRGYGFSVDEVAAAAGVHKTTVYRRWETKPALVAAAAQQFAEAEVTITSSGDPETDLTALVRATARALRSDLGGQLLRAVFAAAADDPTLVTVVRNFLSGRYEYAATFVRQGQATGVLRVEVDPLLMWQAMVNPLHMSALCGVPPSDQMARRLARLVIEGARAQPGTDPSG